MDLSVAEVEFTFADCRLILALTTLLTRGIKPKTKLLEGISQPSKEQEVGCNEALNG
jgi:hypothetical protein